MMRTFRIPKRLFLLILVSGSLCRAQGDSNQSLAKLRSAHETVLEKKSRSQEALEQPPEEAPFQVVQYQSPLGPMQAYLSQPEEGEESAAGEKGPAIVWLTGGVPPAGPGAYLWESTEIDNEQSARIYRLRGITMLFPTVRGTTKENPGSYEWFYGEVDDVVAACQFLAKQPHVDPKRVYVGGHSGGGTLALLVAASTDEIAGVIAFGPTDTEYNKDERPYSFTEKERHLRWPIKHLDRISVPTYIIAGGSDDFPAMERLEKANENKLIQFFTVKGSDHFNVLHPANSVLSEAILASKDGPLGIDREELTQCYLESERRAREVGDLELLADYRSQGLSLEEPSEVFFYFLAGEKEEFTEAFTNKAKAMGFECAAPKRFENANGVAYYAVVLSQTLNLLELEGLFKATAAASTLGEDFELHYDDWSVE